ncbi:MAG: hypothetical protein JNK84_14760 [Phreatobacter sp.]|uniref:hypothetical protein n=1 Tax=Phreatobacter sp. TaxID=1966341 RepID=UPI001A5D4775|nr:hypothetical protein [Phreatobacter sp.]MBL8570328.1 hypothetical protein [Phreatobacter sp.]
MPAHLLFLARHALIGFALAAAFVGAMAAFDVAGLWTLAGRSGSTGIAFSVLTFFFGLTFASIQMGAAIMLLPCRDEGRDRGGGGRLLALFAPPPLAVPARVRR